MIMKAAARRKVAKEAWSIEAAGGDYSAYICEQLAAAGLDPNRAGEGFATRMAIVDEMDRLATL